MDIIWNYLNGVILSWGPNVVHSFGQTPGLYQQLSCCKFSTPLMYT